MWIGPPGRSPLYPTTQFACAAYPTTLWGAAILLRLYFELIGLCAIFAPMLPKKLSVPVKNCLRMGPTSLANRGPEKFERQESGA